MYRLWTDLTIAIAIVIAIMLVAAMCVGHAETLDPAVFAGCKIRTAIGVSAIVIGSLMAGCMIGVLAINMVRVGR